LQAGLKSRRDAKNRRKSDRPLLQLKEKITKNIRSRPRRPLKLPDKRYEGFITIVFGDFNIRKSLPAYKAMAIEFTPEKEGEYEFT
jgi:hypothetical protein